MDQELIIIAIHKEDKAWILKELLESKSIKVYLEELENVYSDDNTKNYYIKVESKNINKALSLIEEINPFNYGNQNIHKAEDNLKRILVAVDFSDYSKKACQVAFNIASEIHAKVKILHVYQNIYFPSHIPFADSLKETPNEGLLDKTRKKMLNLCVEIDEYISNGDWPSINYSYSLREGQVDEEVENFVLEYKPSLLVLGTKGLDNTPSILGNVTADIIEIINVPVLAIPVDSPINSIADIKHVVFLSTLQNKEMPSFNRLLDVFKPYPNIRITLLHINQINRKGDKWTNEELAKISQSFEMLHPQLNINYKLIDSPDIALALSDFIIQENVSIISLNTRRRNLFSRIFFPSKSRKLLLFSDKALLIFRG